MNINENQIDSGLSKDELNEHDRLMMEAPGATQEQAPEVDFNVINTYKSNKEDVQATEQYLKQLDIIFGQFISEKGSVKASNLQEYLDSTANLGDFIAEHEEYYNDEAVHYDIGYLYIIDAAINSDDSINEQLRDQLASVFYKISPNSSQRITELPIPETATQLSENNENLIEALRYIHNKLLKMRFCTKLVGIQGFPQTEEQYKVFEDWKSALPERYTTQLKRAMASGDVTFNPMQEITSTVERIIEAINEDVDPRYQRKNMLTDAKEEFFQEAQEEFGGNFRPPKGWKHE